jgi:hypothetical protein
LDNTLEKILLVFFGAAVTWVVQQYRLARSEDVALVNEHIKDIEKLSDAAQAYWLKVPADANAELELSGKVRACHATTTLLYEKMTNICGARSSEEYVRRYSELFSVATGGDFESATRSADPTRAIDATDIAARIVHILRLERSDVISGGRALRQFARGWIEFLFPPPASKPWLKG